MSAVSICKRTINVLRSSRAIYTLLLALIVLLPSVRFTALPTQGLTLQTQVQADQEPDAPYRVYAPHWSNEAGLSTTIFIRNVQINRALTAKVSLILNHRTITLPQTRVDSLRTIAIDVAKELANRGERVEQSGGAIIDFEAQSAGGVRAYAQVLDTIKGISFTFPFMLDGSSAPGPLEAVAWYPSNNTDAFIALQNTTEMTTAATATLFVSGRAISLGQRQLKPREVVTIKLPSPEGLGTNNGPHSAGVRVEYDGNPGAVVAQGWVVDERIGFSAPFTFRHRSNCNCSGDTQHLYGVGVQIGSAGAMMGLAPGTIFSPYLAARNNSDKPLAVRPIFSYSAGNGIEKATLPTISLGPQESTLVNLREFQEAGIIPLSVGEGNIDLQYNGEAGALIAELASVDQRGGFVSPVPLICNGNKELHMTFWRTDGDWHSLVTIENIASVENDVEITISYPGGRYVLEKRIAAGETIMVSINELQQSQAIPASAKVGGINIWSRNVVNGLVINAMLVNPVARTCGECGAQGWVTKCWLTDSQDINITSLRQHAVGDQFRIFIRIQWTGGLIEAVDANCWSSSNTTVASCVDNQVAANSTGTATITGRSVGTYPTNETCSNPQQLDRSGSLTVVVPTVSFSSDSLSTYLPTNGNNINFTATISPSTAFGLIRFELYDISRFVGDAMNHGTETTPDYDFGSSQSGFNAPIVTGSGASTVIQIQTSGIATTVTASIYSRDFGGFCKLRVIANIFGTDYTGTLSGTSNTFARIPKDDNDNKMPDAGWTAESAQINEANTAPASDQDNNPAGNGTNGDGLTDFEEYRGVYVRGNHKRLNPFQKDLFIDSDMSVNIGYANNLPVTKHWVSASELDSNRYINFNYTNSGFGGNIQAHINQRGVLVRQVVGDALVFGATTCGAPCNPNTTTVSQIFVDVIRSFTPPDKTPAANNPPSDPPDDNAFKQVTGHEIGHTIGVGHYDYNGTRLTVMVNGFSWAAPNPPDPPPYWTNIPSQYDATDNGQIRLH